MNCTELRKLLPILILRLNVLLTNIQQPDSLPTWFVRSIIDNFDFGKDNLIIPQSLFGEGKAFTIHLPFSPSKESLVKTFVSNLIYFNNEKFKFNVVWNTKKVQSLFPSKNKVDHYSCVIY